jgi:hypothetical protein
MKDVEIAFATGSALQAQSDEYTEEGAISAPATVVAKAAATMTAIPVLGPFALATEIAATSVANIAKIFGYSRVPNLEDQGGMRPYMFSNSSQVTGKFSNAKLSLDPKMEVSVGDGGYGIVTNKEDLTLSGIAMKEAWISNYPWVVTNDPNTVIGTLPVSCGYTQIQANTNLNTPAAFVGNLFKYWRGTVRYRIKVLANKFARGRIAIIYESRSDSTMPLLKRMLMKVSFAHTHTS